MLPEKGAAGALQDSENRVGLGAAFGCTPEDGAKGIVLIRPRENLGKASFHQDVVPAPQPSRIGGVGRHELKRRNESPRGATFWTGHCDGKWHPINASPPKQCPRYAPSGAL